MMNAELFDVVELVNGGAVVHAVWRGEHVVWNAWRVEELRTSVVKGYPTEGLIRLAVWLVDVGSGVFSGGSYMRDDRAGARREFLARIAAGGGQAARWPLMGDRELALRSWRKPEDHGGFWLGWRADH